MEPASPGLDCFSSDLVSSETLSEDEDDEEGHSGAMVTGPDMGEEDLGATVAALG